MCGQTAFIAECGVGLRNFLSSRNPTASRCKPGDSVKPLGLFLVQGKAGLVVPASSTEDFILGRFGQKRTRTSYSKLQIDSVWFIFFLDGKQYSTGRLARAALLRRGRGNRSIECDHRQRPCRPACCSLCRRADSESRCGIDGTPPLGGTGTRRYRTHI